MLSNIVKAVPEGLINNDQFVFAGEEAREQYRTLHSSPGNIRLLCFTFFTFVKDTHKRHRFSLLLWDMEEILHESKMDIFLCLRCKLGYGETASNVFENLDQPGCFRKTLSFVSNYFQNYTLTWSSFYYQS